MWNRLAAKRATVLETAGDGFGVDVGKIYRPGSLSGAEFGKAFDVYGIEAGKGPRGSAAVEMRHQGDDK